MTKNKRIVLLLAAGKSQRMGGSRPKQYIEIDGESVLLHTMRAFEQHPLIDHIYVACNPEWRATVEEEVRKGSIRKFRGTIEGGETAFQTISNGIQFILQQTYDAQDMLLVHDAVRPLISQDIISRNISVCTTHGNAITALGSHEAFILSKDGHTSEGYLPRDNVFRAQTPHTFLLSQVHQIATAIQTGHIQQSQSLFTLANEVGIGPLYIAQGELVNFKITNPSDFLLYQALKHLE